MKCEEFEPLLADALGGEISPSDRIAFEEHIARCDACRCEHESARRALAELRSLPAPRQVSLREVDASRVPSVALRVHDGVKESGGVASSQAIASRSFVRVLRYAAGLLIAFTAGYALHAGLTLSSRPPLRQDGLGVFSFRSGTYATPTFEAALVRVHTQKPTRSDLAKAMIAMVPRR